MPPETRMNGKHNGSGKGSATVSQVTTHASSLAYDLITLTELQVKLAYLDLREVGARSARSGVSLAAMVALLLSALPVVLLGLAALLVDKAGWSHAGACLLVGGIGVVVAIGVGFLCVKSLRRVTSVFSRTQQELQENLEFVKSLVGGEPQYSNPGPPASAYPAALARSRPPA
jgi:hypothetical protein